MKKFAAYADSVRHYSMDFFRMFLGIALVGKGAFFVNNMQTLFEQVHTSVPYSSFIIAHYVVFASLLIAMGLLTRIACAVNIPVLAGAVLFVHGKEGLFAAGGGLELAFMVLFALCVVFWYGSGDISVDKMIDNSKEMEDEEEKELRNPHHHADEVSRKHVS